MIRPLSWMVAVALCATATLVPAVAQAQSEPEVVGIELVAHPDQADRGRRGLVSVVAEAAAGTSVEREVEVSNGTRSSADIVVYVDDATIDERGFVPDDGAGPVSGWARVDPSRAVLAARERTTATVTIAVPADALNGEYYAVIWVQPPADDGDDGIGRVNRVGIRVYLTVVGGSTPVADPAESTDFVIDTMEASTLPGGERQVRAHVRNTGERAIDVTGELSLRDGPGGTTAGPFPTDGVTTIGIGGDAFVTVALDAGLPPGPWLARILLRSGTVERAAEASFTFPESAEDGRAEVSAEMSPVERQRRFLIPLAGTMILTILVMAAMLLPGLRGAGRPGSA